MEFERSVPTRSLEGHLCPRVSWSPFENPSSAPWTKPLPSLSRSNLRCAGNVGPFPQHPSHHVSFSKDPEILRAASGPHPHLLHTAPCPPSPSVPSASPRTPSLPHLPLPCLSLPPSSVTPFLFLHSSVPSLFQFSFSLNHVLTKPGYYLHKTITRGKWRFFMGLGANLWPDGTGIGEIIIQCYWNFLRALDSCMGEPKYTRIRSK